MSDTTTNKPIQVLRRRGVKVSVFQNQSGATTFHKVAVQKIYREDGGDWKTTNSLGRDDLPVAQMLIGRAWEYILDLEAGPREESAQRTESVRDV